MTQEIRYLSVEQIYKFYDKSLESLFPILNEWSYLS